MIDALNGEGSPALYGYDLADNLVSVMAPNGATTTYLYDDLGNLLAETSADSGSTLFGYDQAGNVICRADGRYASGYSTCESVPERWIYRRDALGRVESIDFLTTPDFPDVGFAYDGLNEIGRLDRISRAAESGDIVDTLYDYNRFGDVVAKRQSVPGSRDAPGYSVTGYDYDGSGRIKRMTYPSGRAIEYDRDALGRIQQVRTFSPFGEGTGKTLVRNVLYEPFGPPRSIALGNGLFSVRFYDMAYRTLQHGLVDSFATVIDYHVYTLDEAGNILSDVDPFEADNSVEYVFDALHRLIDESRVDTDEFVMTYAYDANGNRVARHATEDGFVAQSIDYGLAGNPSNRMTTFDGLPVIYDGAGNLLSDGGHRTFRYDAANRLQQISTAGNQLTMLYNGLGELARAHTVPSCPCGGCANWHSYYHFGADGRALGMVQQSNSGVIVERDWIWLDGIPVAQVQESYEAGGTHIGTQVTYLHVDHLGTPRVGTDEDGVPTWRNRSDAFGGGDIGGLGTVVPLRAPGQIDHYLGDVYYNYYRDYDSATGRYLQSDPIGLEGGLNTFGYARQNPLRYIDPLGLVEWNGYLAYEGIGTGITTNFFNWYLESECFEGEKLQVVIRGESDFLSSLSVGASSSRGKTKITLNDPWEAPSSSNLSRTGSNSFVYEALGLGLVGASNVTLGDATTDGWDWALIRGGVDFSLSRIAGETEILKEKWTSCGCDGQ